MNNHKRVTSLTRDIVHAVMSALIAGVSALAAGAIENETISTAQYLVALSAALAAAGSSMGINTKAGTAYEKPSHGKNTAA